jgi:tRNA pseudouridine55 synthase
LVRVSASGVLVVNKPHGPTSHDIVARARRLYATREVGHAGTLDPMATGVLVLLFGEARKLSGYLTDETKRYRARVFLGRATDTDDAQGRTIAERAPGDSTCTAEELGLALSAERARALQTPPAVSAIKVQGERAHRLSRAGRAPVMGPRPVEVHELVLTSFDSSHVELELTVSKGYYVRSLARDLGIRLGIPAHLDELCRTASGSFELRDAVPWPLEAPAPLLAIEAVARRVLPGLELSAAAERDARQGKRLRSEHFSGGAEHVTVGQPTAWYAPEGQLVAIGRRLDTEQFAVIRGFRS